MDHRFSRRLLGIAIAIAVGTSFLAPTPARPSTHPIDNHSAAQLPPVPIPIGHQPTAAVVLPSSTPPIQPRGDTLDGTLQMVDNNDDAIRNGLVHSSKGMQALAARDRAAARQELEASIRILAMLPQAATPEDLRLQLIEETARLKAALTGASAGPVADSRVDEQEEENEADTEATPDLVVSDDEPTAVSPSGAVVSLPDLDLSDFDVPIVLNERVQEYIEYYQTRKWGVMSRALERSGRYLPMMREIFREQGLPEDLVNLAYVESGFNSRAYSRAKASGIWQFIKATGNRYGMRVNYWLDERRDPEKATRAAAAYLKDLYEMFQSWPLALAAYNAGEHRVQRAIETQGTTDFWSLRLPKETELFVPAFMAATIIAKDPDQYGFVAPVEEPWEVERVTVPGAIKLSSVAQAVGVSSDLLRDLNPALMRGVTPVHAAEHQILLPPGTGEILMANLDRLPRYTDRKPSRTAEKRQGAKRRKATGAAMAAAGRGGSRGRSVAVNKKTTPSSSPSGVHVVKRGDTLYKIARTYGVDLDALRRWNDLDRRAMLKPGLALRVVAQASNGQREKGRSTRASAAHVRYRVRRGDTLWEIARVHDVTPDELRRWNDLGHKATLLIGQELRIRVSES
ncbi:MAG: hypothetical protein C3F12_12835 [Candidatus Methylomirabilota bacterium]|nr:transglycosylase SLT domain-containing protein [Candidatus Methylomirabilis sp.]PWB42800.1 MAG: hypothetical protein C3F12_12835 [candidate division NC10 bacterium]